MKRRAKAYLFLVLTAAIWGLASPIIKFTLRGIDPFPFLAYRFAIAALAVPILLYFFRPKLPKKLSTYFMIIIYGLLATTFALGFLFIGLDRSTVLDLGLISAVNPLLIALGGALFYRDHITKKEKIGILIAFMGTLITVFEPILDAADGAQFTGNIFLVLYLLSDAGAILLAKKILRKKIHPLVLTSIAFIIGALTIIPFTLYEYGTESTLYAIVNLESVYHLGVFYMALISGTLAYLLLNLGERTIEVSEAALFTYLTPLFSIPVAIVWLNEKITPIFIVGTIFITTGVIIAEGKKARGTKKH